MTTINKIVWNYIDNRLEIKKPLLEGLINISALARKIAGECRLEENIDAVISAIRRYENRAEKKAQYILFYDLITKAKISTRTKLASLLVKRTDETERKVSLLYANLDLKRDSIMRIFEVTNYIKIIMDDEFLGRLKEIFSQDEIQSSERNISEVTINYSSDITRIPGVFATLSNELAMDQISIIDSMICYREHIIIVAEEDLERAFRVLINLTNSKASKR